MLEEKIDLADPDLIIHTASLTDVDLCERNPDLAYRINVKITENLANACKYRDIPMVFISSDYIYPGTDGPYSENDVASPLNIYGMTKLRGEEKVKSILGFQWIILRTSFLFNPFSSNYDYISFILGSLTGNKTISVDDFRKVRPTPCYCIPSLVEEIIMKNKWGTYHICGSDLLTPYEIAVKVTDYFHIETGKIEKRLKNDKGAKRPKISDLDTAKARDQLFFNPPSLQDSLNNIGEYYRHAWRDRH